MKTRIVMIGFAFMLFSHGMKESKAQLVPIAVSASSNSSDSFIPEKAVDGDLGTFWSSSASSTPVREEWFRLDFDRLAYIDRVTLTPRTTGYGFPTDFRIEYSYDSDGNKWFPVPGTSFSNLPKVTTPFYANFTGYVVARRLRVVATKLTMDDFNNYYFQLVEVSVRERNLAIPFRTNRTDDFDGQRIITGENSRGADIYALKWAPRSNTIGAERDGPPYWWEDILGHARVDNNGAKFGNHQANGGAIFYTSFFDVLARMKFQTIQQAENRLQTILDEYRKDQLRRDPLNSGGAAWMWGIIGEFPESGLVGALPVYFYAGLDVSKSGLIIHPQMPSIVDSCQIQGLRFAGTILDLTLTSDEVIVKSRPNSQRTLYYQYLPITPGSTQNLTITDTQEVLLMLEPMRNMSDWLIH